MDQIAKDRLPKHIGLIMDGNGRWAKKRALPRYAGHSVGAKTFRKIVRYCNKIGIKYLTVYAFSTENWKRPQKEIDTIINLLRDYLNEAHKYLKENIQTQFIGDLSVFDNEILAKIQEAEEASSQATGLHLNIAINYGGRNELTNAFKTLATEVQTGNLDPSDIDEERINQNLYTKGQPYVDLIIRPSGEYRISNFLIWQAAYAEYIFMDILWPDFNEKDMRQALDLYAERDRRFGGI